MDACTSPHVKGVWLGFVTFAAPAVKPDSPAVACTSQSEDVDPGRGLSAAAGGKCEKNLKDSPENELI